MWEMKMKIQISKEAMIDTLKPQEGCKSAGLKVVRMEEIRRYVILL